MWPNGLCISTDSPGLSVASCCRLEGHSGEGHEVDQDAGVHDVPAVAPPVPADQPGERERDRFAVHPAAGPDTPVELLPDGAGHEPGQRQRHRA